MKIKPLKNFKLLAVAGIAGMCSLQAKAQIGVKVMQMQPRGDIGYVYKNGIAYEVYYAIDYYKHRMRSKVGFFHSGNQPITDTFRTVSTEGSGANMLVKPGIIMYEKLNMNGIFIDHSVKIVKVRQFALHAGIGLTGLFTKYKFRDGIEGSYISATYGEIGQFAVGVRGNIILSYQAGENLLISAEAGHSAVIADDWTTSFSHHTLGIGVAYYFKGIKSYTPIRTKHVHFNGLR